MGNQHHQGYGSSSLWGLYNIHTDYYLNDDADNTEISLSWLDMTAKSIEPRHLALKQTWLTCIWSCEEKRSGCEETGSPSAGRSHRQEWHSLCLCNLCPFPECRLLWRWHLCPHFLSWRLRKKKQKVSQECKQEEKMLGRREREKDRDINP